MSSTLSYNRYFVYRTARITVHILFLRYTRFNIWIIQILVIIEDSVFGYLVQHG